MRFFWNLSSILLSRFRSSFYHLTAVISKPFSVHLLAFNTTYFPLPPPIFYSQTHCGPFLPITTTFFWLFSRLCNHFDALTTHFTVDVSALKKTYIYCPLPSPYRTSHRFRMYLYIFNRLHSTIFIAPPLSITDFCLLHYLLNIAFTIHCLFVL
jgi:hypothetical protein